MSLPRLKNRMMEPPCGWIYKDLSTNMWITSHRNLDDLINECRAHRHANNLPIPADFAERVESSIAYSIDPALVLDLPDTYKMTSASMALHCVQNRTNKFLLDWRLKDGMRKVSQEEADARAFICVKCPNDHKGICMSCKGLDVWLNGWTGRKTKHDAALGTCAIDGIILYATVHADVKHDGEFIDGCWKKTKKI